jgi:hypothetical protein
MLANRAESLHSLNAYIHLLFVIPFSECRNLVVIVNRTTKYKTKRWGPRSSCNATPHRRLSDTQARSSVVESIVSLGGVCGLYKDDRG